MIDQLEHSHVPLKRLVIFMLIAASAFLGIDIHTASLPSIMAFMHTNKQHMQQSISLYLLGMGGSMLVYGPLSDKFGRKPVVIFGLSLDAFCCFSFYFISNVSVFLSVRLIQGIGSGVCVGLGRTMMADVLHGDKLASFASYFGLIVGLSPIIAPAIGGMIQEHFGWQTNFLILGSFICLVITLFIIYCPETNLYKNPQADKFSQVIQSYKSLLGHKLFMGCTIITGVAMAANMAYATVSPFILQVQFHLSPATFGWVTAIGGIGGILGRIIMPFIMKLIGSEKTMEAGLYAIFITGLILFLLVMFKLIDVPILILSIFFVLIGQTFIAPNTTSRAMGPFYDKRGVAGALYGSLQMLIAFGGSAFIASFASEGTLLLSIVYSVLGAACLILYHLMIKTAK